MKAVLLLALLAVSFAAEHHHMSMVQLNKIKNLQKERNTAGFLLDMAELHVMAQGPMEELLEAIGQALEDLDTKLEDTHQDYAIATDQHETEVARLNGLINKCISQIQATQDNLNEVLYVLKGQLEQKIAGLEKDIEETQDYIKLKTAENNTRHEEFEVRQKEHQEAIEVLNKCLEMLSELNGDGFSLAQLKEKKTNLHKFHEQIKSKSHLVEQSMITALMDLATSEFTDKKALQKVIDLLNESRNNLTASLAKEVADDKAAQKEYEDDMKAKNNFIEKCRAEITDATKQLEVTNDNIEASLQFLARRKADLAKNQKDLQTENENFEETTKRYEELVAQIQSEQSACREAVEILQKGDFADYIENRVDNADNKGNAAWQAQDHDVDVDSNWK